MIDYEKSWETYQMILVKANSLANIGSLKTVIEE